MKVLAVTLNAYVSLTEDVKLIMGIVHHKVIHDCDGKRVTLWLSRDEIVGANYLQPMSRGI